ncbi:exodeoxyribonuclease III [bacterium]|nr:exodeoxyribonuclease III [bacterium]
MKTLKLISWNVNGLRAVYRKNFMEWFRSENADVVCLQETKSNPDQLPEELLTVPGYQAAFSSAEKKGYSGVAVYSRPTPRKTAETFGDTAFIGEGRVLALELEAFRLYNIYFPNGKASAERLRYKMAFYESFLTRLRPALRRGERIVVCGDVNTAHRAIDLARPKENEKTSGFLPEEREWMDRFLDAGFSDTFRMFEPGGGHYTWWDMKSGARKRNVGWRIDYFFVSASLRDRVRSADILKDVEGSDHAPIRLELEI